MTLSEVFLVETRLDVVVNEVGAEECSTANFFVIRRFSFLVSEISTSFCP